MTRRKHSLGIVGEFIPNDDKLLRFRYKNWKGNDHEYVIEPEKIEFGHYSAMGAAMGETNWVLHGMVVTRDGDLRPDMEPSRRRTFLLTQIREPEEIERSR